MLWSGSTGSCCGSIATMPRYWSCHRAPIEPVVYGTDNLLQECRLFFCISIDFLCVPESCFTAKQNSVNSTPMSVNTTQQTLCYLAYSSEVISFNAEAASCRSCSEMRTIVSTSTV